MTTGRQSVDLASVDRILARLGPQPQAAIAILQAIQEQFGYLPPEALEHVAERTFITPAQLEAVASFYTQFRRQPVGRHMISVCNGTACHVRGAEQVYDAFARQLALADGRDTSSDGLYTLRRVACLGCCTLAPAVQIDDVTFGHLTPQSVSQVLRQFAELQQTKPFSAADAGASHASLGEVLLGLGSCCQARGSAAVREALERALARWSVPVAIRSVSCVGICHQTPLLEVVEPNGGRKLYAQVQADDVEAIVLRHFRPAGAVRRLMRTLADGLDRLVGGQGEAASELVRAHGEAAAFLDPQRHIATEHCGQLDPLNLEQYRALGGFEGLQRARAMTPEDVIAELRASGLRGRGGGGYLTWLKWQSVRQSAAFLAAQGEEGPGQRASTDGEEHGQDAHATTRTYVICNGDEGDPGAFMDRMLLESYPLRVLEGMLIAAHAVGAEELIFYIRAEYPLAVQRVTAAIEIARKAGLLKGLTVSVRQGAGAFVCGEETALIASLEGRRGMPRLRPPYPAEHGLHGRPTLVNNVETLAMVPWIVRHGGAALAGIGTEHSHGTKVFALAGKVNRGGLVEVPMGVTLRQIVQEIGGGTSDPCTQPPRDGGDCPEGELFKAVQIGGPSGGCIPASLGDTPVDYQALAAAGAIMGSGGLVVLDRHDCMVEIARYFLEFTQQQSCGRCTFCRIGTRRMLDILTALCEGRAQAADLQRLEQLARQVKQASLCGLGKTAPNPVLTTLRYFRAEYEAHLRGQCPAGRCKALIRYEITAECNGCTLCAQHCPVDAIAMRPYRRHEVDDAACTRCGVCRSVCPAGAVVVQTATSH